MAVKREPTPEPVEGYVSFRGYRTWYQSCGHQAGGVPLVLLHGGPKGRRHSQWNENSGCHKNYRGTYETGEQK